MSVCETLSTHTLRHTKWRGAAAFERLSACCPCSPLLGGVSLLLLCSGATFLSVPSCGWCCFRLRLSGGAAVSSFGLVLLFPPLVRGSALTQEIFDALPLVIIALSVLSSGSADPRPFWALAAVMVVLSFK